MCSLSIQEGDALIRTYNWLSHFDSFLWIWFRSRSHIHNSHWDAILFTWVCQAAGENTLKNFKSLFFFVFVWECLLCMSLTFLGFLAKGLIVTLWFDLYPEAIYYSDSFCWLRRLEVRNSLLSSVCSGPSTFPLNSVYKQTFLELISPS